MTGRFVVTKGEVRRLGERIATGPLTLEDEALFQQFVLYCDDVLQQVIADLTDAHIPVTERVKNRNTIREKIQRDQIDLRKIQDIAGCRVVLGEHATLQDQRELVDLLVQVCRKTSTYG